MRIWPFRNKWREMYKSVKRERDGCRARSAALGSERHDLVAEVNSLWNQIHRLSVLPYVRASSTPEQKIDAVLAHYYAGLPVNPNHAKKQND